MPPRPPLQTVRELGKICSKPAGCQENRKGPFNLPFTNGIIPVTDPSRAVKHLPSNCPSKPGRGFYEPKKKNGSTSPRLLQPPAARLTAPRFARRAIHDSFLFLCTFSFSGLRQPFWPGLSQRSIRKVSVDAPAQVAHLKYTDDPGPA